jgi:hypothetical protein
MVDGSATSVREFQCYQAGDCNSEVELLDHGFQVSQAAGEWINRNDTLVTW